MVIREVNLSVDSVAIQTIVPEYIKTIEHFFILQHTKHRRVIVEMRQTCIYVMLFV